MKKSCPVTKLSMLLVLIGAINWGLVGAFNGFNLVEKIFGSVSWLESLIYILVGLAGVFLIVKCAMGCKKGGSCGDSGSCGCK